MLKGLNSEERAAIGRSKACFSLKNVGYMVALIVDCLLRETFYTIFTAMMTLEYRVDFDGHPVF
jgi:hypothetical protein